VGLQDTSPDRLLAVRQVVSLYEHDDPFRDAQDVQASAEIIYVGWRNDAVTEVVESSRDAQAQGNDAVRQALMCSQDLAKAATERFLSGLVAVVAVGERSKACTRPMSLQNRWGLVRRRMVTH
jgi:hypothetical protein